MFTRFYKHENERILLGFFYGSEYPIHRYRTGKSIPEGIPLDPSHFPVDPYLDDFDELFARHEECGGDFIWSGSIFWGIPWLEAAIGCPIILNNYNSGSIHAEALPQFSGPDQIPLFSMENRWVHKAVEFLEKMAVRSNGRWPLATTRIRGISDLLSLLYGVENLIFAMMEKPEEVNAVSEKLTNFWIEFGKMQIERIPMFHKGIGSFYYNCWAPAGTIWHQEDAVALLSPELYDSFIKPWDEKITDAFDGCIMHQHSSGFFPYDRYINMDFTALELHIDEGGPSAEQLFPVHLEILDKKPLIIWGNLREQDLDWIFGKLSAPGLSVITCVNSPEEARLIWDTYMT